MKTGLPPTNKHTNTQANKQSNQRNQQSNSLDGDDDGDGDGEGEGEGDGDGDGDGAAAGAMGDGVWVWCTRAPIAPGRRWTGGTAADNAEITALMAGSVGCGAGDAPIAGLLCFGIALAGLGFAGLELSN